MEIRQLRYAVQLAETLHFGQAAEREFIAQSAFSLQIGRLERELGTLLFERAHHRVALTPAGSAFVARARRMLDDLELASVEASKLGEENAEVLRVGIFGEAAGELTHLIFSAFAEAHSRVRLEFTELSMVNQLEALKSGRVDVAILRSPIFDSSIDMEPMFCEPRVAVVPASHPLADAETLCIADLVDQKFAVAAEGAPAGWASYWSFDDLRGEPSRIAASVHSINESLATVAYAGAVDTFPGTASRMFPHPGVRYIPLMDAEQSTLCLTTVHGDRRPQLQALSGIIKTVVDSDLSLVPGATPVL
jgi:DNA-binding transcriptional LysR family regulator